MKNTFIKTITILTTLLLILIPSSVNAATSGTCGNNLTWTLDSSGTLTISGTGAMPDWDFGRQTPWSDNGGNNSKITKVIIEDGVTTIGNCAFEELRKLEKITLNDDIQSIGNYAFNNCYGLKMVRLDLPYSLTSIGNYAFFGCNISIINVPNTVTHIGTNAFAYSENLEELRMQSNTYYSSLNGNLYNGDKTKLIQYLENDTSFTIPDTVTTVGEWAFYNYNNSLETITIPESVTTIESSAFYKCSNLKEVIYCGTKAQWNEINIGSSNTPLSDANIQFLAEDETIAIQDIAISTGLSKNFRQIIVVECNVVQSFNGRICGKIYDENNNLLETVSFNDQEDFYDAEFYVENIKADYTVSLQILDENDMPISDEYTEKYSTHHRPIIKGYITDKRLYEQTLHPYVQIKVLTDEGYVVYNVNENRIYINDITYKKDIQTIYNAIQTSTSDVVYLWLNDDNTVRVISNKRPDAKTMWKKSDDTFNVTFSNMAQNDKIIFACYENEQLKYLKIHSYTNEETISFTPDTSYNQAKIMVWNSENLMPLCEIEEFSYSD